MSLNSKQFLEECRRFLNKHKMLSLGDKIVVGVSGGADSVCLLHTLCSLREEYGLSLIAVHINHGIRGDEALFDSEFTKKLCERLSVEYRLFEYDCPAVSKVTGEGLEACGRRLRYNAFERVCEESGFNKIATAHNANDNAETVLFNISRGTSLRGAGIPPVRGNIIRPILFSSRSDIENYCRENSLEFVTDSTNLSDDYSRNRIRHLVLPELKKLNSGAVGAFSRFSESAFMCADFVESAAKEATEKARTGDNTYSREILLSLHDAVLYALIASVTKDFCNSSLDYSKISAVAEVIKIGGKVQLFGDYFCFSKGDVFSLEIYTAENEVELSFRSLPISEVPFGANFGKYFVSVKKYTNNSKKVNQIVLANLIDCDKIIGTPMLRTRLEGDVFSLPKRNVSKSLKKLFNEAKIPPEKRAFVPIISDDSGIVWIYGFGSSSRCRATPDTVNFYIAEGEEL